jgi:hypothetical protein
VNLHPFTSVQTPSELTAVDYLARFIAAVINEQLGRWIEHIYMTRIACWYNMVDAGCQYENAAQAQTDRSKKSTGKGKEGTTD